MIFYFSAAISSLSKRGVPKPVAGSHPLVALNPYLRGSPPRPMALVPNVTSVNASAFWYRKGFRNPMGALPCCIRASFKRATMPAKAGVEADVPPTDSTWPLT